MVNKKIIISITILLIFNIGFIFSLPEIEVPESSIVYDINNRPIKGLAEQNRIGISLDDIAPEYLEAVIAVEDKNFYKHKGLDFGGMARAVYINLRERRVAAGGSTITQQTAKNLFLTNERTFGRKFKELIYAIQLEQKYSKEEILTFYCNSIYFGHGAYGVEVAARTFFDKGANEINLAEAALLAGLPNWPSRYNPYNNPEEAKKRQAVVLNRMVEEKVITNEERQEALEYELVFQKSDFIEGDAPYFIGLVRDLLVDKYGERMVYQGGLKVYTTLDIDIQRAANQAYSEGTQLWDKDLQAALVAVDVSNGHIRALIGGRDYTSSTYNRVFSKRQPGSTFKPFVYSLAIDNGYSLADMFLCEEVEYELFDGDTYKPTDYGSKPYHNKDFTLKEAVMISDNIVAVKLNHELGPENSANYSKQFGFSNIQPILSLPLGSNEVTPLEMALGYAVFANQGIYSKPIYVLKVTDKNGKVLFEDNEEQTKIISEETAYIINNMLAGVLEPGGTGSHLKPIVGIPAAGKTGTTDSYNDAWFVGYTPHLSCAVWVGYDLERNVNRTGGSAAGPIWANFIRGASQKLVTQQFNKPKNINIINICLNSGLIASEYCPRSIDMAFLNGSEPDDICFIHIPNVEYWAGESRSNDSDDIEQEDTRWWQRIF